MWQQDPYGRSGGGNLFFSAFGIPVVITPGFWIVTVIMGLSSWEMGVAFLLLWVAVCLLSITVHELGHALAMKGFGEEPLIVLWQAGGYATSRSWTHLQRWKRVVILLAGPGAGLGLYGLTQGVLWLMARQGAGWLAGLDDVWAELLAFFFVQMLWVNGGWSLVNLLPVLPLDGGRVCEEFLTWVNPHQGGRWALVVSVVCGLGAAIYFFNLKMIYAGMLMLMLTASSFQAMSQRRW